MMAATVDRAEIERFQALAGRWWDENGPFAALHRINPARLSYLRHALLAHFHRDARPIRAFEGLSVLDIGCGGGLVAEALARMGFAVTAIDAASDAIDAARAHASESSLTIDYRVAAVEDLASTRFDVVTALEIIEHTADASAFMAALDGVLRPGGMAILSTLNRTPKSYALGILAAEYLLGWVPRGTHHWTKFVRPAELAAFARASGWLLTDVSGLHLDLLRNKWMLTRDLSVNYLAAFAKP